jgi:serine/threonine protein kinase
VIEYEADPSERTVVDRVDELVGTVLDGRYRLDQRIAEGGFGAVYRATYLPTGVEVAIKVLHSQHLRDPDLVARFRREGEVLASLRDPHTVAAYELGEADGTLFIAMELLHGESLQDRFSVRGPLPWPEVVAMARAVCTSLAEAHALGVVHRDLKPSNIHIEPGEVVKVIDFGIAKFLYAATEVTQQGQMIGTFDYMAPEQLVGAPCGAASDIYTLGVVMYEMISGVRPFPDEKGPASMLTALLTRTPPPLSAHTTVPAELDAIVMRCLEREQAERFPNVGELAAALARLVEPPPLPAWLVPLAPLPPLPTSGFEARGSEHGISHRARTEGHERLARRVALVFAIAVIAAIVAIVIANS